LHAGHADPPGRHTGAFVYRQAAERRERFCFAGVHVHFGRWVLVQPLEALAHRLELGVEISGLRTQQHI
jgi:hypothetical protein